MESQPVSHLYMWADWTVPYVCRCLRRCWPGSITTGTKGSLCCRSCCRRSDFLCVDLSSWRIESSRTASYAAAISAGETQVPPVLLGPGSGCGSAPGLVAQCLWCFLSPVRDLVDEAKDFHLMPERRPHLPTFKTRQRSCTSISGLIYAVGGLNSSGEPPTPPPPSPGCSPLLRLLSPPVPFSPACYLVIVIVLIGFLGVTLPVRHAS